MTASDEELAYYRAVEDFFTVVRGVPHLLSSKDFQLLRTWWREGVPLTAVTSGISEVFARRRDRGDEDPVVSLSYCRHAVARQARRLAEVRAGSHDEDAAAAAAAPRRRASDIASDLRSAAAALGSERAGVQDAIAAVAAAVEAGEGLPEPLLEERLFALESLLLARCRRALPEAERAEIERAAEIAASSSGASGEALERTRRAVLDRELRRRLGLPRLELA